MQCSWSSGISGDPCKYISILGEAGGIIGGESFFKSVIKYLCLIKATLTTINRCNLLITIECKLVGPLVMNLYQKWFCSIT